MAGGLSKCPEYKCNRGVMDTAYVRLHCVGGDFPFTTVRDAVLENYYKDKAIPGCVPVVYMAAQVLLNSCFLLSSFL